jgi:hypothetical protein
MPTTNNSFGLWWELSVKIILHFHVSDSQEISSNIWGFLPPPQLPTEHGGGGREKDLGREGPEGQSRVFGMVPTDNPDC